MSETYTAEEYRDVLNRILDMDVIEREKAFGVSKPALKYVTGRSYTYIMDRRRNGGDEKHRKNITIRVGRADRCDGAKVEGRTALMRSLK